MINPDIITSNEETSDEENPWEVMAQEALEEYARNNNAAETPSDLPKLALTEELEDLATDNQAEQSTESSLTAEELKLLEERLKTALPPFIGEDGPIDLYNPSKADLQTVKDFIYDKQDSGTNNSTPSEQFTEASAEDIIAQTTTETTENTSGEQETNTFESNETESPTIDPTETLEQLYYQAANNRDSRNSAEEQFITRAYNIALNMIKEQKSNELEDVMKALSLVVADQRAKAVLDRRAGRTNPNVKYAEEAYNRYIAAVQDQAKSPHPKTSPNKSANNHQSTDSKSLNELDPFAIF